MKTLRYIEGNELTLYIPAVLLTANGPTYVAASNLSQISVHLNNISLVPMTSGNNVLVQLGSTLKAGMYSLDVKAMYEGRKVRLHVDGAVEIVGTSRQSNWQDFITASTATVDAQIYIADSLMTDEEFEALKDEYQGLIDELEEAIADAEAAKEEADAAAYNAANTLTQEGIQSAVEAAMEGVSVSVDLTPVTTRLDSTTYGLQAIKTAVDSIEVDVPEGIAMESNATANKNAIIAAIPSVPTDYAKETTALAAKNAAEAAKTAAENITIPSDVARVTDLPTDYAKAANIPTVSAIQNGLATSSQVSQIDQKLGDFDDSTAADEIADIKEAVGDALDYVTGNTAGYVSNAEIARRIGNYPTGRSTKDDLGDVASVLERLNEGGIPVVATPATYEQMQQVVDSIASIVANEQTLIDKRNAFGTYVFTDETIADSITDVMYRRNLLKSVEDENVTTISGASVFSYCSALQSINLPNLTTISAGNTFQTCSHLQSIRLPNIVSIHASNTFASCPNLIDIELGSKITSSFSLSTWNPTNVLDGGTKQTQLLANIRNHIAANIPDRTGLSALSITLSAAVKAAINADATTIEAFTSKNWTLV